MEIQLPIIQVEVAMPNFLLRGDFQPRGDCLVFLNDRSYGYFRFERVSLMTLSPGYQVPKINQPAMTLNRQHMIYVALLKPEQAERLQVLQTKRPIVVYTDWCAIRGDLHVNTETRDDDLFDQTRDFFALSNASIYPIRSMTNTPVKTAPYILISRHLLSAYHVHGG